jgi:flagellar biosynthesis protein FlhG
VLDSFHPGFGGMADQAAGLRRLLGCAPLHGVALAGCGATTLAVNLAAALGACGSDVLVVDENASHGNVADQLGVATRYDLVHALDGGRALHEVMRPVGPGVRLLPAARGVRQLTAGAHAHQAAAHFAECLSAAPPAPDLVLIDSANGGVSQLLRGSKAYCETVIVTGVTREAITAAYTLIKSAALHNGESRFRVIVNRARGADEATAIFSNMAAVAKQHAGATLELLGWMPNDPQLRFARLARRSAVEAFPAGAAAAAARALALRLRERSAVQQTEGAEAARITARGAQAALAATAHLRPRSAAAI